MIKKINEIYKWKFNDILKVLLGCVMFCGAINVFIVPNNLYNGGILGLSQLIRSLLVNTFGLKVNFDIAGVLYYIINLPLFVIAYKRISKTFFARTLLAVTVQTLLFSLIPIPDVPLVDDLLVCVLIGGIIGGAGVGILLSCGASSGGTDIIGVALAQRNNNLSVGKLGLFINIFIFGITGLLYGIPTMIYSIIYSSIDSVTVDKMHEQNICSTAFIFCKKNPKAINDFIKEELGRDFTFWDAKGGYDDSRSYIIYTALSKYELQRLERHLKDFDDNIFMVKSEGVGIRGEFKKNF